MPRHREAKTYAEALKLIDSFAPNGSTVWVEQTTQQHRDRRIGYVSTRIEFRCSICQFVNGESKHLVSNVRAPTPGELVKKVLVELLKHVDVPGLPAPRSPRPRRKAAPRRLTQSLPLLAHRG